MSATRGHVYEKNVNKKSTCHPEEKQERFNSNMVLIQNVEFSNSERIKKNIEMGETIVTRETPVTTSLFFLFDSI